LPDILARISARRGRHLSVGRIRLTRAIAPRHVFSELFAMRRSSLTLALVLALSSSPLFAADAPKLEDREAQPSYILANSDLEVAVTKTGGHMTATFARGSAKPIAPYHVSPWQTEGLTIDPPILRVLRGDFFCMPFGGNAEILRDERFPPHGETANAEWRFAETIKEDNVQGLKLTLPWRTRPVTVEKFLWIVDGQPVVYSSHVVIGFQGPSPVAHHANLAMPAKEGVIRVSTSPIRFGITNPTRFSDPAKQENQALAINAKFTDLTKVPKLDPNATPADCTRMPQPKGAADFFGLVNHEPAAGDETPAWVAAVNTEANTLWFALKDARVLPMTYFWIENGGRHGSPWNGRNNCLGLEDACSYFADGLAPSIVENILTKEGVKTAITFKADAPTTINYIQGAVGVPAGFDRVASVSFTDQAATFKSESGKEVVVPVSKEFLRFGKKAFPLPR
jgi:hypothetical protein